MKVLITGAAGVAGQAVCRLLSDTTVHQLRLADVAPLPAGIRSLGEFIRCDTRTPADVDAAMTGMDGVIHLAAWHCAHQPPVGDETIFAVNVDGTFNVIQAARRHKVKAMVFASSMAYGHGGIYGVTKVLGEDLCRCFHSMTNVPTVCLRYHDFVPKPYLAFGNMLLLNGVDRRDVARATVAALEACFACRVSYFVTVVHHLLGCPPEVSRDFGRMGLPWLEAKFPGAAKLLDKYCQRIPDVLEQHDLSQAEERLGWEPRINFLDFLNDLQQRDSRNEDVKQLWSPGQLI